MKKCSNCGSFVPHTTKAGDCCQSCGAHFSYEVREKEVYSSSSIGGGTRTSNKSRRIVVGFAPHPDDELLSFGGFLVGAKSRGYTIHLVWLTSGSKSQSSLSFRRKDEALTVAETLGASPLLLDMPDGHVQESKVIKEAVIDHDITEQTYYRWRRQYGSMGSNDVKRLKDLEKENTRLKKLVVELSLDKDILKEALEGNY